MLRPVSRCAWERPGPRHCSSKRISRATRVTSLSSTFTSYTSVDAENVERVGPRPSSPGTARASAQNENGFTVLFRPAARFSLTECI
jgi:hypothetical protein